MEEGLLLQTGVSSFFSDFTFSSPLPLTEEPTHTHKSLSHTHFSKNPSGTNFLLNICLSIPPYLLLLSLPSSLLHCCMPFHSHPSSSVSIFIAALPRPLPDSSLPPHPLARPPTTVRRFSKNTALFHEYLNASPPTHTHTHDAHTHTPLALVISSVPLLVPHLLLRNSKNTHMHAANHTCDGPQARCVMTNTPNR